MLREQCQRTLYRTQLEGLGQRIEAKVRDNYIQSDRRIIVVSDRVSAFDVIVGTLPFKGQILNDELRPNRGIKTVTGCTLTVNASTRAARRILAIHQVLGEPAPDPEEGDAKGSKE